MGERRGSAERQINIINNLKVVLRHKLLVSCILAGGVILAVIVAIVSTPVFQAKAVILPIQKPGDQTASGGTLGNIAAQMGVGAPSLNKSEIINLLKSEVLREQVIRKYELLPVMFERKLLQSRTEERNMWSGMKYLRSATEVVTNPKDAAIVVTFDYPDRKLSAQILTLILKELTERMSGEAKRVAEANKKYLESQVDTTADPFIKAKIYALIADQIENMMMAEVKENFAFKVIDPPRAPLDKIRPKRLIIVLASFIVFLFLGVLAAFGREYVKAMKVKWHESE